MPLMFDLKFNFFSKHNIKYIRMEYIHKLYQNGMRFA